MEYTSFKEMNKYLNEMSRYKRKCRCSHIKTVLPPHINKKGYEICDWCGRRIYYDKDEQKRYDFKEEMRTRL